MDCRSALDEGKLDFLTLAYEEKKFLVLFLRSSVVLFAICPVASG
jgi:hypothetical protein